MRYCSIIMYRAQCFGTPVRASCVSVVVLVALVALAVVGAGGDAVFVFRRC